VGAREHSAYHGCNDKVPPPCDPDPRSTIPAQTHASPERVPVLEVDVSPDIGRYVRAIARRIRRHVILFGSLRSIEPVNPAFGSGRGTPIDRYYLDRYLDRHAEAITGHAMEVGGTDYLDRFGRNITKVDVLHFVEGTPGATIIGDLASIPQVPDGTFDCIVLTQTLHYVYDMEAAVAELHRILAPNGTLLCSVSGLSQISRHDMDRWGDRWRLTSLSAKELFCTAFAEEDVEVETFGNVLSALCFIEGIPAEKLHPKELDANDADYQILVAITARKGR
jgi:SAM-dependent methyltransferase